MKLREDNEVTETIWAETSAGGLLKQLFGCYPTVFEAKVISIEIHRPSDGVTMELEYRETSEMEEGQLLAVRIRFEWSNVHQLDLPMDLDEIMNVDFRKETDHLVTSLEVGPGVFGRVVSEGFEAVLVKLDPGPRDETAWIRLR